MKNKKYSIIYSSLTGNTKELADAIHEALPQDECEYFGVSDTVIPSSELLYIGFWTDKGNADTRTLQLNRFFCLELQALVAVISISGKS